MKRLAFLVALLAFVPLAVNAQTPPPTLVVAGEATVTHEPDRARVTVAIITNDDNAARSAGKNSDILRALRTKLAGLGIAAAAIRTLSFNVNDIPHPPKSLPPEQRQARYGFVTTREIAVVVDPIDRAGKVVDAATAAGVTQIDSVVFELRDYKALYRTALAAALADAKANSSALAASGEVRIVRIARIVAGNTAETVRLFPLERPGIAMAKAAAPTPTEIAPNGPIDVTARLEVTYEIR